MTTRFTTGRFLKCNCINRTNFLLKDQNILLLRALVKLRLLISDQILIYKFINRSPSY
jgi:uncharacterized protein YjhX (UPF0386 family)